MGAPEIRALSSIAQSDCTLALRAPILVDRSGLKEVQ
jgi:hypothetical protein